MWTEQDNLGEQIPVIGIRTVCVNQQSIGIKEHKTPILVKKKGETILRSAKPPWPPQAGRFETACPF